MEPSDLRRVGTPELKQKLVNSDTSPKDVNIDFTGDVAELEAKLEVNVGADSKIQISTKGNHFVDLQGRHVLLRGVNVSGSSKMPRKPLGSTHLTDNFYKNVEDVDFVGRPFPLDECDEHFRRLRCWGFNYIRLVITWESIEHKGPGLYDHNYIKYLKQVCIISGKYGIYIYVDPHQDVWSRFTGGCGAPAWTLELAGFDVKNLPETGACVCQQTYEPSPEDFPLMLWPTNLYKLACATMFTLFWSGNDFAPQLRVGEGECKVEKLSCVRKLTDTKDSKTLARVKSVTEPTPIQDYLQDCYITAISEVAKELKGLGNVLGFGTMNEPHNGYQGIRNLNRVWGQLRNGVFPTPFQSFCVGDGIPTQVRVFVPGCCAFVCGTATESIMLNPKRKRAWLPERECIWKQHGVWNSNEDGTKPKLLKPNYFANGKNWSQSYYLPFAQKYVAMLQKFEKGWHCYIEVPPIGVAPDIKFPQIPQNMVPNAVNATHWYDGFTLFSGNLQINWNVDVNTAIPKFFKCSVRAMFNRQIGEIKEEGETHILGGAPTVIGEFGIPFNSKGSQFTTGDFSRHTTLLDMNFVAMEVNLVNYTIWNYTNDNDNKHGDQWNFEDLSMYSPDQAKNEDDKERPPLEYSKEKLGENSMRLVLSNQEDMRHSRLYNGGRALDAVVRPYALAVAGEILESRYDMHNRKYHLSFNRNPAIEAPTKVFLPLYPYVDGVDISWSAGASVKLSVHPDNFALVEVHCDDTPDINGHCTLTCVPKDAESACSLM